MPPIFSHGRLRLYLLKLLEDGPKHGYELMRLLQERFQGLYAPSAGSIYPRLAKLEEEGLVSRVAEGNRMAYTLTGSGRAELEQRADEIAAIDREIQSSVADLSGLADQIQAQISGGLSDIRRQLREQTRQMKSGVRVTPKKESSPENEALLRKLEEFTAEARTLIARARPGAAPAKAVAATLDATLRTLRELLR
ncbi:MAG: helix-turn-helix transcriptional regulator [Hamadaea sp.]|uniref:PadR family transcriptional regulator n=1 Tax=Hamadaea sp. TaxID=2024425 RepID=UPI00182412F9|nr:PadR family transcriptional regulator [Hamadaea sp.]NUR74054.1 helix-turn-helix transcriptional regulator [Hamadaea sp.]NUT22659.1 helix-turn-helix transcriptional regulator [Hamadaea sp.]